MHGELDFTKEEETEKAVRAFRPEVLLHCGAISDVGACEREPELSLRVNVEGTRNLARACREAGARMVMCSSDQVYFRGQEEGESREAFLSPHRKRRPAVRFRSTGSISCWRRKPVLRNSRTA